MRSLAGTTVVNTIVRMASSNMWYIFTGAFLGGFTLGGTFVYILSNRVYHVQ
jgi:hypothetical protein